MLYLEKSAEEDERANNKKSHIARGMKELRAVPGAACLGCLDRVSPVWRHKQRHCLQSSGSRPNHRMPPPFADCNARQLRTVRTVHGSTWTGRTEWWTLSAPGSLGREDIGGSPSVHQMTRKLSPCLLGCWQRIHVESVTGNLHAQWICSTVWNPHIAALHHWISSVQPQWGSTTATAP